MPNHERLQQLDLIENRGGVGLGCLFREPWTESLSPRPMFIPITERENGAIIISACVEHMVFLKVCAIAKYSDEG